jgi:dTDP-4-amino-4,6-dideoxygalactose transaminase
MHVKFLDLSLPTGQVQTEYLAAVKKLLDKGSFVLTEEVKDFEQEWAKVVGTKYCVGVSSGADALLLSLLALGIGPGDEVIIQGNAYNASVVAILRAGATPRFADIDPETLTLNIEEVEKLITPKTKAILPVHLYGTGNNMPAIMQIAKNRNLKVLEDCAQAHLAEINGKMVGSFGDIAAFSFYPTKNLGAFGDAGAIVLNDSEIYEKLIALRNLGQKEKNNHIYLGFNNRLDPIQAMALSLKLKRLPALTKEREEAGEYYNRLIEKKGINIKYQKTLPGHSHVYHLYPILLAAGDRSAIQNRLLSQGVETGVYYPVPVYKQPFYKNTIDACPVTDPICENILCLPMYFGITKEEQEYVIDSLKTTLENGK